MGEYKRPIFKAAAIQAAPVLRDEPIYFDLRATLKKACDLIAQAGANGAKLIVFPEGFLPTFPYWSIIPAELYEWTLIWKEFVENSVEVPSAETEAICRAAKEADAYVVIGINERDKNYGGRMYNSALFVSPVEGVLGVHRKVNPTLYEQLYHTRGDGGETIKVFKTELGNIGSLICGEHLQLPLLYNMVIQGEQINCSLWPGSRRLGPKGKVGSFSLDTEIQISTRALCISGCMFSISASCCIPEDQRPKKFYPNACFDWTGGSSIINPMGEYVAEPVYDVETIVYGDIDLGCILQAKAIHNLTGSYGRWDLFALATRQKPYQPIIPLDRSEELIYEIDLDRTKQLEERIKAIEEQKQAIYTKKRRSE